MDEEILNRFLRDLKFIVIADSKTKKPIRIHFGFNLPNEHYEIFLDAQKKFNTHEMYISVQGGGKITKKANKIYFHSHSERYGRYEDDIVLLLDSQHELFQLKK